MNIFFMQYFEKPQNLKCLVVIPVIVIFLIVHFYIRHSVIKRLLGKESVSSRQLKIDAISLRYFFSGLFFVVFVSCLIIALSAPRMGKKLVREFRRGADVALAYDVSKSMDLKDVSSFSKFLYSSGSRLGEIQAQSRLERAAELGEALVLSSMDDIENRSVKAVIPSDIHIRFALALGKGNGFLAVPLTSDAEAILAMLSSLSSDLVTSRGTNLENIVDAAASCFDDNFSTAKMIVLFSDGEALDGELSRAAERCKENGVVLYAVGVGGKEGAVINVEGLGGVTSALNEASLTSAASLTGGAYIDGGSSAAPATLAKITSSAGESSWNFREETISVWHIFIIAGLFSLLFSKLCGKKLKRP
ncbi:MAG: VWA domain-containing protein [Spirochaetaceae bacterium]|nr:VWA domain-containing protein [Spirochaetaceae bacterium]